MNLNAAAKGIARAKTALAQSTQLPNEVSPGIIPTRNNMGFSFTELSRVSQAFVDFASECDKPILDIGCAYGVATLPALANSHCRVFAADLCHQHLEILQSQVKPYDLDRISTITGDLRASLNFPDNSLAAIHCSNILHFFRGAELEELLTKMLRWLAPGGKIFASNVSIYGLNSQQLVDEYYKRVDSGEGWPGEISNVNRFQGELGRDNLEDTFIHVFTYDSFKILFSQQGFDIEDIHYYQLSNFDRSSQQLFEHCDIPDSETVQPGLGIIGVKQQQS